MTAISQQLIDIATKIIEDKEGFAKQDELKESGVETVLSTKTYSAKNIPAGLSEQAFKESELLGEEIVKCEGIVDLSIEDLITVFKRPDTKKFSNPKILKSVLLEDTPKSFITYTQLNSGSSFVSSRSNLVENVIIKENGSVLMVTKSIPTHPKLAEHADEKKESIVRAIYHCQAIKLESMGASKTKYTMIVSVSLEGMIPGFVQKTLLRKTPLEIPKGWLIQKQNL